MSDIFQYGYPPVPKSITNSAVVEKNALDKTSPMSFLTFIKTISDPYEPESLNSYYKEYISRWNSKKKGDTADAKNLIREQYRDLLKDIQLNYTTNEERQFLSKINFNDPLDLDIALSFYSKKLKQISEYYTDKRNNIKYDLIRKKLVGSIGGLERALYEKTIEFIENSEEFQLTCDISKLKEDLRITCYELYNTLNGATNYFNVTPDEQIYDFKDRDYGEDIFLINDSDLIDVIFATQTESIKTLKEADDLFENKRKETQKYMGSDYYYLSTGSTTTQFVSGKLFNADSPAGNLLNRNYPTTASTKRGTLEDSQELGFFKPSKIASTFIDGGKTSFKFNTENLSPNSIYYFPDPYLYGEDTNIISFTVDDEFLRKNYSNGSAANEPTSYPSDTTFYGYTNNRISHIEQNFEHIFESGYIREQKHDIYSNTFGLFFNDTTFKRNIEDGEITVIKSLLLNGHSFYDNMFGEGFSFDYTTYDNSTYDETLRAGISTNTGGFSALDSPYYLFFRFFDPYEELISPKDTTLNPPIDILEGAYFTFFDNSALDDPISSDLSAFPNNESYYHSAVYEGGLHTLSQRALLDSSVPSITANFTIEARTLSSATQVDGGLLGKVYNFDYTLPKASYEYNDTLLSASDYTIDTFGDNSYFDRSDLNGQLFIRKIGSNSSNTLTTHLPYLSSRYSATVFSELSTIQNFDIAYDTLFIETPNYLIMEQIKMTDYNFVNPKTPSTIIQHNKDFFNKISNRFQQGNSVYYFTTKTGLSAIEDDPYTVENKDLLIYPEIHKFDIETQTDSIIFPITNENIFDNYDFFNIGQNDVVFVEISTPRLTYNSRNDIFALSYLAKDQNQVFHLVDMLLRISDTVKLIAHNVRITPSYLYSNVMTTLSSLTATTTTYLSSSTPSISSNTLIL